jgi:hypothetical protein
MIKKHKTKRIMGKSKVFSEFIKFILTDRKLIIKRALE